MRYKANVKQVFIPEYKVKTIGRKKVLILHKNMTDSALASSAGCPGSMLSEQFSGFKMLL